MSEEPDDQALIEAPAANATLAKLTVPQIAETVEMLSDDISHDQMLGWLLLSSILVQRAKEIRHQVEQRTITWINANGPIQCGTITYSVGKQKRVKCLDVIRCLELLLDACGGDLATLAGMLRSDPFRYGECGKVLDDALWKTVFSVDWPPKLVVKNVDSRFLPAARR